MLMVVRMITTEPEPPTTNSNGSVTSASYAIPADINSNSTYDYAEIGMAAVITVQPPNISLCPGCSSTISVTATNANTYQWQKFNGSIWIDLSDAGIHSGTTTNQLTITNATPGDNGNQYRVLVSNTMFICTSEISNVSTMSVRVNTVITNRRITYRVNND